MPYKMKIFRLKAQKMLKTQRKLIILLIESGAKNPLDLRAKKVWGSRMILTQNIYP